MGENCVGGTLEEAKQKKAEKSDKVIKKLNRIKILGINTS
jgi:hypothetical protein